MQLLTLGTCPPEEDSVQVRTGQDYMPAMHKQAVRFKAALQRRWPELPPDCRFKIATNQHNFGRYLDVAIEYPDDLSREDLQRVVSIGDAIGEIKTWEDLEADG